MASSPRASQRRVCTSLDVNAKLERHKLIWRQLLGSRQRRFKRVPANFAIFSLISERNPPFSAGVNRVRLMRQPSGVAPTGTPALRIARTDDSHTDSSDSRWLATAGVGLYSIHVCGAREAWSHGVNRAGRYAARHNHLRESHVEKPRGDDSLADGSSHDRNTGRFQSRVEIRPADAGRARPETDRKQAGSLLCGEALPFTAGRLSRRTLVSPCRVIVPRYLDSCIAITHTEGGCSALCV